MTLGEAMAIASMALAGAVVAGLILPVSLRRAPDALMRTNVDGLRVPAILGAPVVAGGFLTAASVVAGGLAGWSSVPTAKIAAAAAVVIIGMGAAGLLDDVMRTRQDDRGFAGHLRAARGGRLTGGIVKLVAGGALGIVAGAITTTGWAVAETALLVALTANLVNLLDRAPGRAAKAVLLGAAPLVAFGSSGWAIAAAGVLGALIACVPSDLRAAAMLGDAGANPLGAVLGLGVAVSLAEPWRLVVLALVAAANVASERWSYSRVIEATPWLRALDALGRKRPS